MPSRPTIKVRSMLFGYMLYSGSFFHLANRIAQSLKCASKPINLSPRDISLGWLDLRPYEVLHTAMTWYTRIFLVVFEDLRFAKQKGAKTMSSRKSDKMAYNI
jgi:hypothetical protein